MDTIDRAMAICYGTTREDWREVNGAAVHKDAHISEGVILSGDAIIRRGTIEGGTIWGGTIWGGTIRGGTIRGGTIEGGTIEGGTIRGGITKSQPFYLAGYLPWAVCVSAPNELSIGCERHTFDVWRSDVQQIAMRHSVADATLAKVRQVIEIAEAWHAENPIEVEQVPAAS